MGKKWIYQESEGCFPYNLHDAEQNLSVPPLWKYKGDWVEKSLQKCEKNLLLER